MPRRITIPFITLSLLLTPRLGLAQGTLLWQQNINSTTATHYDSAESVAVDNQGNVLAAGVTGTPSNLTSRSRSSPRRDSALAADSRGRG
jgi:hypothetical protein